MNTFEVCQTTESKLYRSRFQIFGLYVSFGNIPEQNLDAKTLIRSQRLEFK